MPTAAYIVGTYTVNREGIVDGDLPEDVLEEQKSAGFTGERTEESVPDDTTGIVINVPANEQGSLTDRFVQVELGSLKACRI